MIATRVEALVRSLDVVLRRRAALGGLLGAVLMTGLDGLEIEDAEAKRKKKKKKKKRQGSDSQNCAATCAGCCDGSGVCQVGADNAACGSGWHGVRRVHRGGGLQRRHVCRTALWRQRPLPRLRHQHDPQGQSRRAEWG